MPAKQTVWRVLELMMPGHPVEVKIMPAKSTTESRTAAHTPTPWRHEDGEILAGTEGWCVVAQVIGADDLHCCEEDIDLECKANAKFIVRAVNSHEQLVEALTLALAAITSPSAFDIEVVRSNIRAALAAASIQKGDGQ